MRLFQIVAQVFSANCYVLVPEGKNKALIVDPGAGTAASIAELRQTHNLEVGAVLLTHGHPDHLWDAARVAGSAPVYVPGPDRERLENPLAWLGSMAAQLASELSPFQRPENLCDLPDASAPVELVPGVKIRALPAPGHTQGSTLFYLEPIRGLARRLGVEATAPVALTGDVIFAGSVGRTDLAGGDSRQMLHSLRTICNVTDPETILLPGHGPATTMTQELSTNPYLRQARSQG